MKEKIKNKLLDKTWKRTIIIFIFIFIVVLSVGVLSVNYLHDTVTNNHIHTDNIYVVNKTHNNNHYIVIGEGNKTYYVSNDKYGIKIFNSIDTGKTYKVVIKEPELVDINHFPFIIQVHNVTG